MISLLRDLRRRRELLWTFVYREIQVRYKQSMMGLLWAILMPGLIASVGIVVKYGYSIVTGAPFMIQDFASVLVKSVPWAFVVASIRFCTSSLISNRNLVTKIYLPRTFFPISAVLAQSFDFLVATVVLIVVLTIAGVGVSVNLVFVPLLIAILFIMVTGAGILLSALSLFFRDVKYLVEAFLTYAVFVTPVYYEVEIFKDYSNLLLLNPVAPIFESLRACVVTHTPPDFFWLAYSLVWAVGLFLFAVNCFGKLEPAFAESI